MLDVLENDPEFGLASARLLDQLAEEGLALCPISYIELAPAFLGHIGRQNEFLSAIGIDYSLSWDWKDTQQAHKAWPKVATLSQPPTANCQPATHPRFHSP